MPEKWDLETERAWKKFRDPWLARSKKEWELAFENIVKGIQTKDPQRIRLGKKPLQTLAEEGVIPKDEARAVMQMVEGIAQLVEKGDIDAASELEHFTGGVINEQLTYIKRERWFRR